MAAPVYTADQFVAGFINLLPDGPIWPRDTDSVLYQVAEALAPTNLRFAARAEYLLQDAFPVQPVELLPEWEYTLGLPDPCAGPSPTVQTRQQQVYARFIAGGGQSVPYFTSIAAALGYTITITEFSPSFFGGYFGEYFGGTPWAFAWEVSGSGFTVPGVLTCEISRLAPANTDAFFTPT